MSAGLPNTRKGIADKAPRRSLRSVSNLVRATPEHLLSEESSLTGIQLAKRNKMMMSSVLSRINSADVEKVAIQSTSYGGLLPKLNDNTISRLKIEVRDKGVDCRYPFFAWKIGDQYSVVSDLPRYAAYSTYYEEQVSKPVMELMIKVINTNIELVPSARDLSALCFMSDAWSVQVSATKISCIERVLSILGAMKERSEVYKGGKYWYTTKPSQIVTFFGLSKKVFSEGRNITKTAGLKNTHWFAEESSRGQRRFVEAAKRVERLKLVNDFEVILKKHEDPTSIPQRLLMSNLKCCWIESGQGRELNCSTITEFKRYRDTIESSGRAEFPRFRLQTQLDEVKEAKKALIALNGRVEKLRTKYLDKKVKNGKITRALDIVKDVLSNYESDTESE